MKKQIRGRIKRVAEGKYEITVNTGWDEAKKVYGRQRRFYYGTLRETEAYMRAWIYELENPEETMDPDTVSEWLDFWLANDVEVLHSWEQNTARRAKGIVEHNIKPYVGSTKLAELNADDILGLYKKLATNGGRNERALSARSIKYVHTILNQALKQAVIRNKILTNPAQGLTPAASKTKNKEKWVALDKHQLKDFLAAIQDHRDYMIIYLAAYTGMRQSELLGLTWGKIKKKDSQISVDQTLHKKYGENQEKERFELRGRTKNTTSTRTVDITDKLLKDLEAYRFGKKEANFKTGDKDLIFTEENGKPLDSDNLSARFRKLAIKHGHPGMTFHHLRHTHATILLSDGAYINEVAQRLGHADPRITLAVYGHVLPKRLQSLASRFDSLMDPENEQAESPKPIGEFEAKNLPQPI